MYLGSRIRSYRKDQGLSLEQLSTKSGVALATLSRIENDKGSSRATTHQKIAEALNVTLADLYRGVESPTEEAVVISPESEEPEIFTYDEKSSAMLLAKQVSGKQMLPQMIMLQPSGKTSLEQYRPPCERWLFALEGSVEVLVGAKKCVLTRGGALYFKASLPHQIVNTGAAAAKIISVTSPAML